jgi:O-glycosyl hydrolase
MKTKKTCIYFVLLWLLISCSKSEDVSVNTDTPTVRLEIIPTVTFQTITGFGGANRMWGTMSLKPAEAQKAFGLGDNELGMSMFRVRISSNKNEWSIIIEAVKEANKRGVQVLASPWSPPPSLKDNNSDIRGVLLPENYTAFKNYINEFLAFMEKNGAKIDVVSIQNEPDWKPAYESCDWTAQEMINFLKAPGDIKGARLAAPESLNFNQAMTNAILNDEEAAKKIDIVAGHTYGSGTAKFPIAEQKKKEIWMTEYLMNLNTGNAGAAKWNTYSESAKWDETIKMLSGIHDAMNVNWNAYIWWYLQRYYSFIGDGEEGTTFGEVLKRGYGYSHFSKFVRPGFVRIDTKSSSSFFLKTTAYKKDNQVVMVIINPDNFIVKNVQIQGLVATKVTSYTTTETVNLEKKDLTIVNKNVSFDMPPKSVSTFIINF